MKKKTFCTLCVFLLTACTVADNATTISSVTPLQSTITSTPIIPTSTPTQALVSHPWWNDTIFYEIKVHSFYDSNGDGLGDIQGLTEKLDYLNDGNPNTTSDLGITGIWLQPIFPSPSDHGYDVTDFYNINPRLGTLEDFKKLLTECHARSMSVIIDLILHNTSIQHPWFIQSREPASPYRSWYVWSDTDPGFLGPWNNKVWFQTPTGWYRAFFWEGSPDLNAASPDVTAELYKISNFWLNEVGVDGFRLDAIGKLIGEGSVLVETKSTHNWMKNYFQYIESIKPDAMTIGEVWTPDTIVAPYVNNHETDLAFEFDLSFAIRNSINKGNNTELLNVLREGTSLFPPGQYGVFLTNHDMDRSLLQFDRDMGKMKVAAALLLTLPGVPFILWGEEIGLSGNELGVQPMQWSSERFAGFSSVKPWATIESNFQIVNVASETDDPASLLTHYRNLISLHNTHPALRIGDLEILASMKKGLVAYIRSIEQETVLVIVNLTDSSIRDYYFYKASTSLTSGDYSAVALNTEISLNPLTVQDKGRITSYTPLLEIPPYGIYVILLEK